MLHETVIVIDALARQSVEVGREYFRVAVGAQSVETLLIGGDD